MVFWLKAWAARAVGSELLSALNTVLTPLRDHRHCDGLKGQSSAFVVPRCTDFHSQRIHDSHSVPTLEAICEFTLLLTESELFHWCGCPCLSPVSEYRTVSHACFFVTWPIRSLCQRRHLLRRDGELPSHSFLLITSSYEWFPFKWRCCCHSTFHNSLRARSVIQQLREPRSVLSIWGVLMYLDSWESIFREVPHSADMQSMYFQVTRAFSSLILGFWLGLDVSKMPSCSNKGSSRHDQNRTVGTEGRLHEREVPSEFKHVPSWVASGQGLQFWISMPDYHFNPVLGIYIFYYS